MRSGGDEPGYRIVSVDRTWRIVSLHPEVLPMFGIADRTAADVIGSVLWEVFPGWVGSAAEQKLRSAMQHHAAADFVLPYPPSGAKLEVRVRPHWPALTIYLREARVGPATNGAGDSTETPAAPPSAPAPLANLACAFDRGGRVTHASVALLDRWKLRLPDAKGRTVLELNYPATIAERLHRHIQRVVATGEPVTDQVTCMVTNGRTEAHEHIFSPLLGDDGTVHGVAGAIRLVAEPPLPPGVPAADPAPAPEAVERARLLGELAGDVFTTEPGRLPAAALLERIASAARAECWLYHRFSEARDRLMLERSGGIDHEQLAGLHELALGAEWPGRVAQHRRPAIIADVQRSTDAETATLRQLGWQSGSAHPLQAGERLLGTVVFGSRLHTRFTEEQIRFLQSAVALVAARLSGEAAARSHAPEEDGDPAVPGEVLKQEFLSAVVQELRVPLEATLAQIRALAEQPSVSPEIRSELDHIARHLTTESRLVNDLLDLSQIVRGELSIEHAPVNVHALLRDALASVKQDLAHNGLMLAMSLPDVAPEIRGDAARLQQVFWNLLKRAVRATPRGGVISVRLSLLPTMHVAVAITDSGTALAGDQAARVFEPWNAEPATPSRPGFGMATVRKIIELHQGKIEVAPPANGHGTCFTVELPLGADPVGEPMPAEPARRGTAAPLPAPRQRRILLVEDQADTREALLILLRQWRHDVIVATSVREARGLAGQHAFDLVISAVTLPDGSGYELMAALRLEHGLTGIALVGNGTEADAALGRSAGFRARLRKPVRIDTLEQALAEACAGR